MKERHFVLFQSLEYDPGLKDIICSIRLSMHCYICLDTILDLRVKLSNLPLPNIFNFSWMKQAFPK